MPSRKASTKPDRDQKDSEKPAPAGERKPATEEEERALEQEELESFRRRREWFRNTFGEEPPDDS